LRESWATASANRLSQICPMRRSKNGRSVRFKNITAFILVRLRCARFIVFSDTDASRPVRIPLRPASEQGGAHADAPTIVLGRDEAVIPRIRRQRGQLRSGDLARDLWATERESKAYRQNVAGKEATKGRARCRAGLAVAFFGWAGRVVPEPSFLAAARHG